MVVAREAGRAVEGMWHCRHHRPDPQAGRQAAAHDLAVTHHRLLTTGYVARQALPTRTQACCAFHCKIVIDDCILSEQAN
jgi:hypothetical protein